nr:hypothetical protein [Azovibrio restrictus]
MQMVVTPIERPVNITVITVAQQNLILPNQQKLLTSNPRTYHRNPLALFLLAAMLALVAEPIRSPKVEKRTMVAADRSHWRHPKRTSVPSIIPPVLIEKLSRLLSSRLALMKPICGENTMRNAATVMVCSLLAACATQVTRMEDFAHQENWAAAFESMQYQLSKETPDAFSRARSLVQNYPKVLQFGFETFAPDKLKKYGDHVGEVEWHKIRLKYFCTVATTEQCIQAKQNVDEAERNIRPLIVVLQEFYEQLSPAERQLLDKRHRIIMITSSEVGVVTDRQLQDISTLGRTTSSQLGEAVGSAAYVDKAFSGSPSNWNYSVSGHIGAQFAGAVIGSILGKQIAEESYRIQYTIRYLDGHIGHVEQVSSFPIGHSIGVCLRTTDLTILNDSMCNGSVETFRNSLNL